MASVTYYVVVPFVRDGNGMVVPAEGKEAPNGDTARRRAASTAATTGNIGAVAFSRTGDPESGEFQEGVILASFGETDVSALTG